MGSLHHAHTLDLGRKDSNLRMAVPKTAALPLGHVPRRTHPFS